MKANNIKSHSLTDGPIFINIFKFAIPLILTGILQQLYNTFDSIIIGKFGSSLALAAVGSSSSFINLTLNLFFGLSLGTSIVVSQYFGARDDNGMKTAVNTSIALAVICGIIMTFVSIIITKPVLILLGTPVDVLPYSIKYLTIYFSGTLPTLLYNFLAGILRATGDSKRPLYYLFVSAVINVVLNLLFVIKLNMDVAGVALATIISQIICCILALHRLMNVSAAYRIILKEIKFNKIFLAKILKLGIPAGINSCIFSFSNLLIQSTINSFGSAAVAGSAAASSIENFVYMPMNAISAATTTFVGQNKGAGKFDRIEKGVKSSVILAFSIGLILGLSTFFFGESLLLLFTNETQVIKFGLERMSVISTFYFTCGVMDVLNGSIRGTGDSVIPMFISIFGVCGIRLLWIYTVLPLHKTIQMLFIAYPISWILTATILFVYFKKGKKRWQSI